MIPQFTNLQILLIRKIQNGILEFIKNLIKLYLTSSTNPKFKSDLADPNSHWKFEVLEWASFAECQQIEFEMLTAVNAKDNPESYN